MPPDAKYQRTGKPLSTIDLSWFNKARNLSISIFLQNNLATLDQAIQTIIQNKTEQKDTIDVVNQNILEMTGVIKVDQTYKAVSQEVWYNFWCSQSVPDEFSSSVQFILERLRVKQNPNMGNIIEAFNGIMEYILYRYFANPIPSGYKNSGNKPLIVDNDSPYYSIMLDKLYDFFMNNGVGIHGIGNNTIKDMCSNFSRTTIGNYKPFTNWCGCFSQDSQIAIDAKKKYNTASYTKSCDPLCMNTSTIKLVNSTTSSNPYDNSTCDNSTLCILTDIDIKTTSFDGTIHLKQNCPCTEDQSCLCIIDSTIEDLLNRVNSPDGKSMALPVTFEQYCPGARCLVEQKDGTTKEIECQNDNPNATNQIHKETEMGTTLGPNIWMIFLVLLGVGVLFILCARHIGYEPKYKVNGIFKSKIKLSKNTRSTDLYLPVK